MRRYIEGEKIKNLEQFGEHVNLNSPFYWHGKYLAAGFIIGWPVRRVLGAIRCGVLFKAVKKNSK